MQNNKSVDLIARGVCVKNGKILLCRNRKYGNVYLLGGHIEFGEAADRALEREVLEETGLRARATRFLAAVQSRFNQRGVDVFELSLLFELEILDDISTEAEPESLESYIEFFWFPFSDISKSGLLPDTVAVRLNGWLDGSDKDQFVPPAAH
ncbi:MAG: NUDIX domain-containing protein [Lentisphaerae bacterium]|jgi:8-oxo-dGTP diphosphatase|nr:NUDIX domain-containing protein [Lentisphaerota bacterium]